MPHPIIDAIICGDITTPEELQNAKKTYSQANRLKSLPTNADILAFASPEERMVVEEFLRLKPTRTLSGVAVVAVMTSPADCPHGKCTYCPGGTDNNTPQSYTGKEPAALRAGQHNYDPRDQTTSRIRALEEIGHPTDKIDLIIMGGTFTAREREYQIGFVKSCFEAMNQRHSANLDHAHRVNETAVHRCVGLTVETRPDHLREEQMDLAVELGATRVELGVQTVYDEVLKGVQRGHGVKETIEATKLALDHGLKVCYHMMPGLPGVTRKMDVEAFRQIYTSPEFMPDMVKIYPALVIKDTKLHDMWNRGEYTPLSTEEAAEVVAQAKLLTPPWVRIQRVQRDIPSPLVEAGVKKSNLRQLAQAILDQHGKKCPCIRCREVGRVGGDWKRGEPELVEHQYEAAGGKETFLSLETEGWIVGFIRLRQPSSTGPYQDMALVRELKVFGQEAPLGAEGVWQHRGHGRQLMEAGEEKARGFGYGQIRVTSGVGVREYYRRLGYRLEGMGMVKDL
ncbi:MAG: tRNA uridine(34) 5-carboxymethylaminomethyl modification radical SAM/GNAT enzyme Elp3 [Candidatus Thermoplasmatota archaeon]|nr:tRNA uridine(34) 5-carboxymethylaminomethyl modification radical SAM/GNAT enzyme Elp3 [Candidatus Thermoplasmatota archaeon]